MASSRRKLLKAGAVLAAAGGGNPAAASDPVPVPDADAELIRLVDQAIDFCRQHGAALSDEVVIPPEVEAETARLSALEQDCCLRAAELPARTPAGLSAKAKAVALANSANMGCADTDPAFYTLESLLDDLMGGEGAVEAFYDSLDER